MNLDSIVKQILGTVRIRGGTDGTIIGNSGNALLTRPAAVVAPSIDWPHHMVHLGRAFSVEHVYELSSGATHDHALVTPSNGTRNAHLTYHISSGGDTSVRIYESPTVTLGSAITAVNRNRNSDNANTTIIYDISAISALGTLFCETRLGMAGGGGNNEAAADAETSEYVLKQNTTYLFRVLSNANSNVISSAIHWYEFDYLSVTG